ncbi:MAG: hypothetical protein CMF51_00285, partial [Legionellales bacterium]|nr:hypothetical protein [Legionellales bacterium]
MRHIEVDFIKIMKALDYTPNETGMCYGIAMMAIQAHVRGDFQSFIERMGRMQNDVLFLKFMMSDTEHPSIKERFKMDGIVGVLLKSTEQYLNECIQDKAFFEELILYFGDSAMPESLIEALNGPLEEFRGVITSQGAHMSLGIQKAQEDSIFAHPVITNQTQLNLDQLDQIFTETNMRHKSFQISFKNYHSLAVVCEEAQWHIIDHNHIYTFNDFRAFMECLKEILNDHKEEQRKKTSSLILLNEFQPSFQDKPTTVHEGHLNPDFKSWMICAALNNNISELRNGLSSVDTQQFPHLVDEMGTLLNSILTQTPTAFHLELMAVFQSHGFYLKASEVAHENAALTQTLSAFSSIQRDLKSSTDKPNLLFLYASDNSSQIIKTLPVELILTWIQEKNSNHQTPLHLAAFEDHSQSLSALLEKLTTDQTL